MKISKIASSAIISISSFILIGCGGSSNSSNEYGKTVKKVEITASDAYVVGFKKINPAVLETKDKNYSFTDVNNGEVIFTIPANVSLDKNITFYIPGDALVDTDGNGKLSDKDQEIRMPLITKEAGSVANPIATAALLAGDEAAYQAAKTFDPVQAKKDLILNPDDNKTKALVVLSEGIAFLGKEAKTKGKDPLTVVKDVNTSVVKDLNTSAAVDVNSTLEIALTPAATSIGMDVNSTVISKVEKVTKVIDTAAKLVKEAKSKGLGEDEIKKLADELVKPIIAVSDGNVSLADTIVTKLNDINVSEINTTKLSDVISKDINVSTLLPPNPEAIEIIKEKEHEENITETTETTKKFKDILSDVLKVNYAIIGDKNVSLKADNTFGTVVLPADGNYSKYENITLEALCLTNGEYDTSLKLNITKGSAYVSVYVPEVIIKCEADEKPETVIEKGTKIAIDTNVAALSDYKGIATVDETLDNKDLSVSLDTIKDKIVKDSKKIESFEAKLTDYLSKSGDYNITLEIKNGDKESKVTGEVIISDEMIKLEKAKERLMHYYDDTYMLITQNEGDINATDFTGVSIKSYTDYPVIVAFNNDGEDTSAGGTMYVYDDNFDEDNAFLKINFQGKYKDKNVTIYYRGDEFNTTFTNGDVHLK